MKLDDARKLITETDALKDLRSWLGAKADNATSFPIPESAFPFLSPLIDARLVELAGNFEPESPQLTPPVEPKKRPKVRASVVAEWDFRGDCLDADWQTWAGLRGFKWSSVRNVLNELRNPVQMVATTVHSPTSAPT